MKPKSKSTASKKHNSVSLVGGIAILDSESIPDEKVSSVREQARAKEMAKIRKEQAVLNRRLSALQEELIIEASDKRKSSGKKTNKINVHVLQRVLTNLFLLAYNGKSIKPAQAMKITMNTFIHARTPESRYMEQSDWVHQVSNNKHHSTEELWTQVITELASKNSESPLAPFLRRTSFGKRDFKKFGNQTISRTLMELDGMMRLWDKFLETDNQYRITEEALRKEKARTADAHNEVIKLRRQLLKQDWKKYAEELLLAGHTQQEVANRTGKSRQSISKIAKSLKESGKVFSKTPPKEVEVGSELAKEIKLTEEQLTERKKNLIENWKAITKNSPPTISITFADSSEYKLVEKEIREIEAEKRAEEIKRVEELSGMKLTNIKLFNDELDCIEAFDIGDVEESDTVNSKSDSDGYDPFEQL